MEKTFETIAAGDIAVLRMSAALISTLQLENAAITELLIKKGVVTQAELDAAADKIRPRLIKALNETIDSLLQKIAAELHEEDIAP